MAPNPTPDIKKEDGYLVIRDIEVGIGWGLCARPTSLIVQEAARYKNQITLEKDGDIVDGKSLMGILMLAAGCGSKLTLRVEDREGTDAERIARRLYSGITTQDEERPDFDRLEEKVDENYKP